eukprot:4408655-Amphidinium_carterae.2
MAVHCQVLPHVPFMRGLSLHMAIRLPRHFCGQAHVGKMQTLCQPLALVDFKRRNAHRRPWGWHTQECALLKDRSELIPKANMRNIDVACQLKGVDTWDCSFFAVGDVDCIASISREKKGIKPSHPTPPLVDTVSLSWQLRYHAGVHGK